MLLISRRQHVIDSGTLWRLGISYSFYTMTGYFLVEDKTTDSADAINVVISFPPPNTGNGMKTIQVLRRTMDVGRWILLQPNQNMIPELRCEDSMMLVADPAEKIAIIGNY
jgi:hypothetical protein